MDLDPRLAHIGQREDNAAYEHPQDPHEQHIQPQPQQLAQPHLYEQSYAPLPLPPQTPQQQQGHGAGMNNGNPLLQSVAKQQKTPGSGGTPDDPTKRPRACEACRGLKVKCEFDLTNPDGPCKRCVKAGRDCTVTQPSRKRQKKTDSRVAELEKKIDALTQTLQATRSESEQGGTGAETQERRQSQAHPYEQMASIAYGPQYAGRAEETPNQNNWQAQSYQQYPRMPELNRNDSSFAPPLPSIERQDTASGNKSSAVVAGQKRKHDAPPTPAISKQAPVTSRPSSKQSITNEHADVIDRGLISRETASALFDRYVHEIAPHMPSVVFPSGTTASDIRRSKPVLFLAILAVGAMTDHTKLATLFTKEVMKVYADRIICRGEKSLELIQALLVSTLWYWPPEHFEEVKFYQLIHLASVMGVDIGIHKHNKPASPSKPSSSGGGKAIAGMWNWRKQAFPDASSIEARRTWLSCYFICSNASTGLRRPNLIHWTPYIAECIEVLETSPLALPSDKVIAQWARSQYMMERIMPAFAMDDDYSNVTLSDPGVEEQLAGYESELDQWRDQVPKEARGPLLKMSGHIVCLFMHEIALNVHTPPPTPAPLSPSQANANHHPPAAALSPGHPQALARCLESIDEIFDTFLSLDVAVIRCLPVMHFVRVAYAIAILIKMYFAAITPNNPLALLIDKDGMKVGEYLDNLFAKFKEIAKDEKSRPGSKFLMVLVMLRGAFNRQKVMERNGGKLPADLTVTARPSDTGVAMQEQQQQPLQQQQQQQQRYGPGSTPLDLLSEVATGTPRTDPKIDTRNPYIPMAQSAQWCQGPWDANQSAQAQAQSQPQTPYLDPSLSVQPTPQSQPPIQPQGQSQMQAQAEAPAYDNAGMVGDGYESIGMMGEGDLSQYFGDDAFQSFFKAMMEGAGTGGMGFDEFPMI